MPSRHSPIAAAVAQQILAIRPGTILAIGPAATDFLPTPAGGEQAVRVSTLRAPSSVEDLHGAGTVDLAVVAGLLEEHDKRSSEMVLGRVRDLHAGCMLLVVDVERAAANGWQPNDLFALGLERMSRAQENGKSMELFGFDIRRYKTTPDWLNARYWANPQLWDKFRW
jgi:hypothetical protein